MAADNITLTKYIEEKYGYEMKRQVRVLERNLLKKARWSNHHIFNMRCRDEGIFPSSVKIKSPVHTKEGQKIACKANKRFLSARIRETYIKKKQLQQEMISMKERLRTHLDIEDFEKVMQFCEESEKREYIKVRNRQKNKLELLIKTIKGQKRARIDHNKDKWLVNLSDRILTSAQEEVLRLGLNFALTPRKLPILDTIVGIEDCAKKLNDADATELRGKVCAILRRSKVPKSNLLFYQRRAVAELAEKSDVVILPADKGNATVVMKKEEYDKKSERNVG